MKILRRSYIATSLIALTASCLPFFYIRHWHPFLLNGPAFIRFFLVLLLTIHLTACWLLCGNTMDRPATLTARLLLLLPMLLGLARLLQSAGHDHPVLYLVLLMTLHYGLMFRAYYRISWRKGA